MAGANGMSGKSDKQTPQDDHGRAPSASLVAALTVASILAVIAALIASLARA
ncbi:hypothetical protein [Lysobacter sp. 22409]|uniref:hypothetical protein n=1 Tax=Lysobacter sp. 22409 TaxID=3453917 RepID=UPI003F839413